MTTVAATQTRKNPSNRAIQRTHKTYKRKSEISEALHLIKPYINESTHKFLSHFLHTDGTGVTQAKITEICKQAEVSTGSYSMTVKREIKETFSQSLIITTPAPMKWDKKHKKRVKASEFKSLLPLSVIKHLIKQKQADEQHELEEYWGQFEQPIDIDVDIDVDIESNPANAWESKDESHFEPQQNKSFREKHLENDLKDLNNMPLENHEGNVFNPPKKEFKNNLKVKPETQEFLNSVKDWYANKLSWNDDQKHEVAKTIQWAINNRKADVTNKDIQSKIKWAMGCVSHEYEGNVPFEEYLAILSTSTIKALKNLKQPKKQPSKSFKKPIRTEILPDWFDEVTEEYEQRDKAFKHQKETQNNWAEIVDILA